MYFYRRFIPPFIVLRVQYEWLDPHTKTKRTRLSQPRPLTAGNIEKLFYQVITIELF